MRSDAFFYDLPEEAIAKFPLAERDSSKLLMYREGEVGHAHFRDLPEHLPQGTLLVFNQSKVIPARLYLQRTSGAWVELLLLEPVGMAAQLSLAERGSVTWKAMVGNKKKWRDGETLPLNTHGIELKASWVDRESNVVRLEWEPSEMPFGLLLETLGTIPLPPYMNREAKDADKERYQTVYASTPGSVAAPTAGLHFTDSLMRRLPESGIETDFLTLHVGAGTFLPMKGEFLDEHEMHQEYIEVSIRLIERIIHHSGPVVAVGTTAMRSLESVYVAGALLLSGAYNEMPIVSGIPQIPAVPAKEALQAWCAFVRNKGEENWYGPSRLFITPGYPFGVCNGIITNFHQPNSTLLVLVEAFIGSAWREVYAEALSREYRFLSYGDSSLLWQSSS
jgi:S-adenosylmethionine:tRNA ribosyltransferase-isomerase